MNDEVFRDLLALTMVSDPWPLDDDSERRVKDLLNEEAIERGYADWVDAYHHGESPKAEEEETLQDLFGKCDCGEDEACSECSELDGDAMAGALLMDAHGVVTASRDTHGDAVENQQHIAQGWTWYLRGRGVLPEDQRITGGDVGRMMPLLKMSRTAVGTYDVDHDRDIAGYAGIAAACEVADGNADPDELTGEAENRGGD